MENCKHETRGLNKDCEDCQREGWTCGLIVCYQCGVEVGPADDDDEW